MKYDYFIGMVKHHQTNQIRAFSGAQQTNPEHIPAAFALLMPEIFSILKEHLSDICNTDEVMVIFGLQPASGMIASNLPLETERFIKGLQPDYHLCCTLDFFKVPMQQIESSEAWSCTDSLVIDFTTGEIMDSDRLLAKLHFSSENAENGKLYGRISEEALGIAWIIAKIKQTKEKGKGFLFNTCLMQEHIAEVA